MKKPGDSTVQTNAEKPLLEEEGFSNNYCDLIKNLIKLTKTQPDCVDESKRAVIEIYARTTAANSGAKQKIAKDILKLIFLKSKLEKFGFNKFEIWLSYDCHNSVKNSWFVTFGESKGVSLKTKNFSNKKEIQEAQNKQSLPH